MRLLKNCYLQRRDLLFGYNCRHATCRAAAYNKNVSYKMSDVVHNLFRFKKTDYIKLLSFMDQMLPYSSNAQPCQAVSPQ